jgi:type IV pilus assembly protein PilA
MKNVQKGFTLIELMIVVAIIAILAAIAIPQYQTYVVKSQVSRAMGEAGDLKVVVEDCLNNGKLVIGDATADTTKCDPTATGSDLLTGAQQGSVVVGPNTGVPVIAPAGGISDAADITITATFGNHASSALAGAAVVWTRKTGGTWSCQVTGGVKYGKYAPGSCPAG